MATSLFALVLTCAQYARAGEIVSGDVFASGTSVEQRETGAFDPALTDEGAADGYYHWYAAETNELADVLEYESGAAYDYAARGTVRSPFLSTNALESSVTKYLSLYTRSGLSRSIFRRDSPTGAFSNVLVRTGSRDSIYCDMVTKFTADESVPEYDSSARLVVWARQIETDDGDVVTNLMVTAGCFTNGFKSVAARDFRLDFDLDLSKWYRLTIRAHGDVSPKGSGLSGFTVYIDGQPVSGVADDYEICDAASDRTTWLLPEARALRAARRLFPSLAAPGSDAAFTVSGLTFVGDGCLDDVTFSSTDPGFAKPEAVFTLNWDDGFSALDYAIDAASLTNAPIGAARSCDILIGAAPTNGLKLVVSNAVYRTGDGYKPGIWSGSNGAVMTNRTSTGAEFVYDGTTRNPIAVVASARDCISVGTNGVGGVSSTFLSAFAELDSSTNPVKVIELNSDFVVSMKADASWRNDKGTIIANNPDGCYVLDLKGHTLQGQAAKSGSRYPTLSISCKSFRIIDSSVDKLGRIKPIQDYTNETECLNTAVKIYPNTSGGRHVLPVVTIQAGIYDGWVRNDGVSRDGQTESGSLYVEGGDFISTNEATFYLESCVTNKSATSIYSLNYEGYWSILSDTNLVIWTGRGDGRHWTDPNNWKGLAVPQSTETALFPSRDEDEGPWTVDVGAEQMSTKKLWLEGDVSLSGTNDFIGVTLRTGCEGRICGDAMLTFIGTLPAKLAETTLRDDWAGTVLLENIGWSLPKTMNNLHCWGTDSSTVIFHGVRGYVQDRYDHTMPYDLVLQDYVYTKSTGVVVTNVAWKNDTGYTGSTLSFTGRLLGDGTLSCTLNTKILQILKFADVADYTGRLDISGKRVLIGSDRELPSQSGLIAFGDLAVVRSGLGWRSRYASFGETLWVKGETNDVLLTSTVAEPDVTCCSNLYLNGVVDVAWLATTNNPKWAVYITGDRPSWIPDPAIAGLSMAAPSLASATLLSSAYAQEAGDTSYSTKALQSVALAAAEASAEVVDASVELADGLVRISIAHTTPGLWYGVRYRPSLAAEWISPQTWFEATGTSLVVEFDQEDESGFYGVVVKDPRGSGGGPE